MPLNFKDHDDETVGKAGDHSPITHPQRERGEGSSKFLLIIGAIAILVGLAYFLYRSGMVLNRGGDSMPGPGKGAASLVKDPTESTSVKNPEVAQSIPGSGRQG